MTENSTSTQVPVGTLRGVAFGMELEISVHEQAEAISAESALGYFDVNPLWLRVLWHYDMVSARWRLDNVTVVGSKTDVEVCPHRLSAMPAWLQATVEHHRPRGVPVVLGDADGQDTADEADDKKEAVNGDAGR